ncbi:MAG: hypothetical protein FWC87_00530 [Acidimicrobiaceae bacterium]|nr:hypothetical protein [Acidimicrobiaceae bacterium]
MSDTEDTPSPQPAGQDPTQTDGSTDQAIGDDADMAEDSTTIETMVAEWKAELEGQQSVSASNVQDRLLDMWGQLPEGSVRSEIEKWLTETVQRHLYTASDIDARLQRVLADA